MAKRSYKSKPAKAYTFELDEVEFTTTGGVSLLDLAEMARLSDVDAQSPQGVAAIADFFEAALGEAEYARLKAHVRKHGTDPETLLTIMGDVFEEVGQVPLPQPSHSSDGPKATGSTYRVVSASAGVRQLPLTPEREAELRAAVGRAATG